MRRAALSQKKSKLSTGKGYILSLSLSLCGANRVTLGETSLLWEQLDSSFNRGRESAYLRGGELW